MQQLEGPEPLAQMRALVHAVLGHVGHVGRVDGPGEGQALVGRDAVLAAAGLEGRRERRSQLATAVLELDEDRQLGRVGLLLEGGLHAIGQAGLEAAQEVRVELDEGRQAGAREDLAAPFHLEGFGKRGFFFSGFPEIDRGIEAELFLSFFVVILVFGGNTAYRSI